MMYPSVHSFVVVLIPLILYRFLMALHAFTLLYTYTTHTALTDFCERKKLHFQDQGLNGCDVHISSCEGLLEYMDLNTYIP